MLVRGMHDYIDQIFGRGGRLAQAFAGYEPRAGQVALARGIDAAFRAGTHLLAEAPTGTGKSVGYLVPAIWHVTEGAQALREARPASVDDDDEGERDTMPRVLVVTANIALQEQLVQKDLPALQQLLPWPFRFALAKGRGNYLCLNSFDDAYTEHLILPPRDPDEREQWTEVVRWASKTERGDLSELPFELGPGLKPKLTVTSDDCTGKVCPRFGECFAERAKKGLKQAHVLVTNYALFFAHLKLKAEFGKGVLPRFDLVVFDEGHKAAEIARDWFGFRVTQGAVRWASRLLVPPKQQNAKKSPLPPLAPGLRTSLLEESERFFDALLRYSKSSSYKARLAEMHPVDSKPLLRGLKQAWEVYERAAETLAPDRAAEVRKAARWCRHLAASIVEVMTLGEPVPGATQDDREPHVYFIEESGKSAALCCKPLDVSAALRERLFEAEDVRSVIVTSATLRTQDKAGGFDFVACELGAEMAEELVVPTPFDFKDQALLVIPEHLPDPASREYNAQIAEWVVDVVGAAQGRTLGLFTSYRGLQVAYDQVQRAFGDRFLVLKQGDAPRTQLIARFREETSSVLLGTESFWAGVDVPGESLSCVVIDRIPFDTPDDPITDAQAEKLGRAYFQSWAMPRAAIKLRQGFGRLIRARSDRGVVVILDRRLIDKPYGKRLLGALPPTLRSRSLSDIATFLQPAEPVAAAGGMR